ncbi:hypothetical protein HF329_06430 [Chitinophaga oryzae]|uniref:Uncharacterized protein n=1 Tax=Chitinophaga oryzae TaxID=2725414 RepID=A0AAE7D6A6_9BACT|nr:hypothetical protein [Chitinophaga oryzae]QJB30959.1 hypothetical protein HF329_06430 [Chitinophaga oryzae]
MKPIYVSLLALVACCIGCSKEDKPEITPDLGIEKQFTPPADAPAEVKDLYNRYGVWVRMDFNHWKEVTNGVLVTDPINRWGVAKIDNDQRAGATIYAQTLLSNVSEKFAKKFFPLELFFVKSYGGSFWMDDFKVLGRSRLVICWPNQIYGALPVTDPANHYFKDSVLVRMTWGNLGGMVAARFDSPLTEFVLAGKAYDGGEARDKVFKQFEKDKDEDARDKAFDQIALNGGFITSVGSINFESDFGEWFRLLATESYANIKAKYLDSSPARARKYEVIIRFFNSYDWDIQAAGNKYREKLGH